MSDTHLGRRRCQFTLNATEDRRHHKRSRATLGMIEASNWIDSDDGALRKREAVDCS